MLYCFANWSFHIFSADSGIYHKALQFSSYNNAFFVLLFLTSFLTGCLPCFLDYAHKWCISLSCFMVWMYQLVPLKFIKFEGSQELYPSNMHRKRKLKYIGPVAQQHQGWQGLGSWSSQLKPTPNKFIRGGRGGAGAPPISKACCTISIMWLGAALRN